MVKKASDLVRTIDYGIEGINFYFRNRDRFNMTVEELASVGVTDESAYVSKKIIKALQAADKEFRKLGFRIRIKDAYRSPALYRLIQQKRYEKDGKALTDTLLNLTTMPHATGATVDIALVNLSDCEELWMRNGNDGIAAFFIGYYADKKDEQSQEYERRQKMLREVMLKHGFKLGVKNEYWHFEYR